MFISSVIWSRRVGDIQKTVRETLNLNMRHHIPITDPDTMSMTFRYLTSFNTVSNEHAGKKPVDAFFSFFKGRKKWRKNTNNGEKKNVYFKKD